MQIEQDQKKPAKTEKIAKVDKKEAKAEKPKQQTKFRNYWTEVYLDKEERWISKLRRKINIFFELKCPTRITTFPF